MCIDTRSMQDFIGFPKLSNDYQMFIKSCTNDIEQANCLDEITSTLPKLLGFPHCMASYFIDTEVSTLSAYNWPAQKSDMKLSFCAWSLIPVMPEILVVPDAMVDARFRQNPYVIDGSVRAYIGVPLVMTGGIRIGNLCVVDTVARSFSLAAGALMCNFAEAAVQALLYDKTGGNEGSCMMLCDFRHAKGNIIYANKAWQTCTMTHKGDLFWEQFVLPRGDKQPDFRARHNLKTQVIGQNNAFFTVTFKPATLPMSSDISLQNVALPSDGCLDNCNLDALFFAESIRHGHSSLDSCDGSAELVDINEEQVPFDLSLGRLIGNGSFGTVFEVIVDHQSRALKVQLSTSPALPLEATLWSRLHHQHVVDLYDSCVTKRQKSGYVVWMLMELCELGGLLQNIDTGYYRSNNSFYDGGPHLPRILTTALQIATGLQYIHSRDVIHGDLTPQNVLLNRNFEAKISDFGLSSVIHQTQPEFQTDISGTITHMPSELLEDGICSERTDVYSFGVLLYELYTSRRSYAGMRPTEIRNFKMKGGQLEFPPGSLPEYVDLAGRCMAADPTTRPETGEIIADLSAMKSQLGSLAVSDSTVYPTTGIPAEATKSSPSIM